MNNHGNITLRELVDEKFKGMENELRAMADHTNLRFDSLDKALNLARSDAKEKYEHLNALRSEVTQDRGLLVQGKECRQTHSNVTNQINEVKKEISLLREAKSQIEGRAVEKVESRAQSNWSTGLTVVTVMSSLSFIIMLVHLFMAK